MSRSTITLLSSAHAGEDARLRRWRTSFVGRGWTVAYAVGANRGRGISRMRSALTLPLHHRGTTVLCADPELAITAWLTRPLRRGPWIADVHEDYVAVAADRRWARGPLRWIARILARLAAWCAARADVTVVADDHVPPHVARHRVVAPNLPARDEIPIAGEPDETPRAVYVGSVTRSRGLVEMVEAVVSSTPWTLDIVGPVSGADREWITGHGDGRVRLHGQLAPGESWAVAAGARVGLSLLHDTPAYREAVPTKLYEYLGAGLAVITTPLPRSAAIVTEAGAGAVVRSAAECADTLRRWWGDPDELAACRRAARAWAETHLPERSPFADAVATIERFLEQRSP